MYLSFLPRIECGINSCRACPVSPIRVEDKRITGNLHVAKVIYISGKGLVLCIKEIPVFRFASTGMTVSDEQFSILHNELIVDLERWIQEQSVQVAGDADSTSDGSIIAQGDVDSTGHLFIF